MNNNLNCYAKLRKVQCFDTSSDYVLIQCVGRYRPITALSDQGIFAQQTMSCDDNENLGIKFRLRPVRPLDFDPHTVTIDLQAKLLYPDVAFGVLGNDGIVYKRINFEEIILMVYEDGKDQVLEMQKIFNAGDKVHDLDLEPEQWDEVESIADYFVDCVIR